MVFSSHIFFFYFLPCVLALYFIVPRRGRNLVLTLTSYVFYGWANPLFIFLMLASTIIDYICGLIIGGAVPWGKKPVLPLDEDQPRSRKQKAALAASIFSNLTMLGFFKYFNFGIESYNQLLGSIGFSSMQWDAFLRITLPLGISFYTFQSMSYSIDVFRGQAKAMRNFTDFACYVSMFPQLVAGPIIRFKEIASQIDERTHTAEKFARGVAFISLGLSKKILLANPCGKIADSTFDAAFVSSFDAWYGLIAYAFQIYFDFSAYSDMAIGLGLMFGFVMPKNFDSPYHSRSITEFWRRWHLSLSSWLRDYLYIPLGGNRLGSQRTYVNLAVVMLLGGLWHGASWNFVIWGGIHGIALGAERALGKQSFYTRLPAFIQVLLTFLIVCFSWVFFRAADLSSSLAYLSSLFHLHDLPYGAALVGGLIYQPYYLLTFAACIIITWLAPQTWDWTRRLTWGKALLSLFLLLFSLAVMSAQAYNPFIYFIF